MTAKPEALDELELKPLALKIGKDLLKLVLSPLGKVGLFTLKRSFHNVFFAPILIAFKVIPSPACGKLWSSYCSPTISRQVTIA